MRHLRPALVVVATASAAGALTLVASTTGWISFAYRSPSLHVALEAAASIISALAAYLLYGRFRASRLPRDLLLVGALAIFAVANLVFSAIPGAIGGDSAFETWAPLAARTLGAGLFAASVLAAETPIRDARRALRLLLGAVGVALVAIGLCVSLASGSLPAGVDPALTPETPERPFLEGNAVLHGLQLAAAALFAFAAVGFVRKAGRTGDELLTWLAVATTFAVFARVNYFLFPSKYSDWVYTGDVLRVGFYLVLLVGVAREIERYWHRLAEATVLEERRRLARDVHAGLAQDIAFVAMQSKALAARRRDPSADEIAHAADRALDEARLALAALSRPVDEPLPDVVADFAEQVAERVGLDVDVAVSDDVQVTFEEREALLRIVGEALASAARQRHATAVRIELRNGAGTRLRISDDGEGVEPPLADSDGGDLGLAGMRRRAQALGGRVEMRSAPGSGTEIEVALP
ncbi:MAG TPA: ATP-binding protein [Gaiellaceae bacterium]|nr:ATP-binding protein [Gaiellaceae bacterium]